MKQVTYKLFPALISLILFFPVLKENISTLTVILLCINTIIYKIAAKDYSFIKPQTLLFTIPFWIVLLSSVFSDDYKISGIHIQHALFFLIIPIVFSLIPKEIFNSQKVNLYFSVLKNLCLLIALIYIANFLYHIPIWKLFFKDGSVFRTYIYSYFDWFVIHPSYYTTILVFCTAHALKAIIEKKQYWQFIYITIYYLITFLLLTKLNFVILNFVIVSAFVFNQSVQLKSKIALAIIVLLVSVSLGIGTSGLSTRFKEIYNSINIKPKDLAFNSTNIRKAIFDCSIDIISKNNIKGIGFENIQKELNNCYKSNYDSSFFINHDYMTHNYYFYILISTGFIGFLFYLIYLGHLIRICVKSKVFLFSVFLLNALAICFIEDYFYRQYGAIFFNVMLMIFIRHEEIRKTGS